MKKISVCLLSVCLLFALCCCSADNTQDTSPSLPSDDHSSETGRNDSVELIMLRQAMIETSYAAAVAYLGEFDAENEDLMDYFEMMGFLEIYPYLSEIEELINFDGQQLYLIVPKDEHADVNIYSWGVDDAVYTGNGEPVLVRGNVSETMPNFAIKILCEDSTDLNYAPCLSGMDGSLDTPETEPMVKDITPYDLLTPYFNDVFDESILWMQDSWESEIYTFDDEYLQYSLSFYQDGTMSFCYGYSGEWMEVFYSGTYSRDDESDSENVYLFELSLDLNESLQDAADSLEIMVSIRMSEDDEALVLTYVDQNKMTENEVDIQHLYYPAYG